MCVASCHDVFCRSVSIPQLGSPTGPKGVLSKLEVRSAQHQILHRVSAEWRAEAPRSGRPHVPPSCFSLDRAPSKPPGQPMSQQASRPGRRFLQKATWPGGFPRRARLVPPPPCGGSPPATVRRVRPTSQLGIGDSLFSFTEIKLSYVQLSEVKLS